MKTRRQRRKRRGGFLPMVLPALGAVSTGLGVVNGAYELYKHIKGGGRRRRGGNFVKDAIVKAAYANGSGRKGCGYAQPTYGVPFV